MGVQDFAVKNQGCGHLFKGTGNILLAIIWQIANRAQLFYVFVIPSATLHNGVRDTTCTDKVFLICLFPSVKQKDQKKNKLQMMLLTINPTNNN